MTSSKAAYGTGFLAGVAVSAYLGISGPGRSVVEPFVPFILFPMVFILIVTGIANFAFYRATGRSPRSVSFDKEDVPLLSVPLLPTASASKWMRIFTLTQLPVRVAAGYLFLMPVIAFQIIF